MSARATDWRLSVLALVAALLLTISLPAAPAHAATTYEITPDGTIYQVVDGRARALTYPEWVGLGSPRPARATMRYVSYPWSSTIMAVTTWQEPTPVWTRLTYDQWAGVGRPIPERVAWIPSSYLYRWSTGAQIGVIDPGGVYHWLTPQEWSAMGNRAPDVRGDEGFVQLTWAPEIMRMSNLSRTEGNAISYQAWTAENSPQPWRVTSMPYERFYRYAGSADIWYVGPTMNRRLTLGEWQAAGAPTPQVWGASGGATSTWPSDRPAPYSGTFHGANGSIDNEMCVLPFMPTHRIHCRALQDTITFNAAYRARFGTDLPIDTWTYATYRTVADQRVVLATIDAPIVAQPGTSPHGWGLAIDFYEGPAYTFGSTIHNWLRTNGPRYGWNLMSWHTETGRYKEYWHFDYVR